MYVSNILSLSIRNIHTLRSYLFMFSIRILHKCTNANAGTHTHTISIYMPFIISILSNTRIYTRRIPSLHSAMYIITCTHTNSIYSWCTRRHTHKQSQYRDHSTGYAREGYTTQSHTSGAPFCVTGCTGWDTPLSPHPPAALPCGRIAMPRVWGLTHIHTNMQAYEHTTCAYIYHTYNINL